VYVYVYESRTALYEFYSSILHTILRKKKGNRILKFHFMDNHAYIASKGITMKQELADKNNIS
jgi:hypothetical protein